jgi:phosphoribosylformimino-5-aminoimidazole carboxamide ribonucleotide (ProFAR) isomerase
VASGGKPPEATRSFSSPVATEGWLETSATPAVELAWQFAGEPIASVVYTDIATDGMLAGPNVAEMTAGI